MAGSVGGIVGCARQETSVLRISMIIDLSSLLEGEGVVSMLCFRTKSRFTNMPVAPESRSADVDMDQREVVAHNTTMTFSERGEFLDKT